jgi:hypothetical protein
MAGLRLFGLRIVANTRLFAKAASASMTCGICLKYFCAYTQRRCIRHGFNWVC